MKFTFEPAPHYRSSQSTGGIMRDLTAALCAVTVFAVIYYSMAFGAEYGLRIVIMMAVGIISAVATEAVFFKMMKQDIKEGVLSSYSWITAMILVLISSVDNSYYAIAVSTILALVFGKLVFGGFGQNIFNPAALGEAIIMNSFASAKVADFATGATPTTAIAKYGWLMSNEVFSDFIEKFGGLFGMALGQYPSTIGSTCAILILICGIVLIIRKDIDWQAPVFYIGTVFVLSAVIGLLHGQGLWYACFQVLAGGVVFGGIFMMTDPVTSPVTIPGRVIFGIGAACFTLIFRLKSNMADGVLYSILLMNMLTPAIEKALDSNQIKSEGKNIRTVVLTSLVFMAITVATGALTNGKTPEPEPVSSEASAIAISSEELAEYEAACELASEEGTSAVYACHAKGFGLVVGMEGKYSENEANITVDTAEKSIVTVEVTKYGDTPNIGDTATSEEALAGYAGKTLEDEIDAVSGATFTTKSVVAMAQAALNAAAGE